MPALAGRVALSGASRARAHAAVALVHAAGEDGGSVLLLRRRPHEADPWSGHWCLPGGRRQADDADLLATALRELREECGLVLGPDSLELVLPVGRAGPPERHVLVAPFVLRLGAPRPVVPDDREMAEACWVGVRELLDPARRGAGPVPGQPPERVVDLFDLPPTPLWGFTWRVLRDWLEGRETAATERTGPGMA